MSSSNSATNILLISNSYQLINAKRLLHCGLTYSPFKYRNAATGVATISTGQNITSNEPGDYTTGQNIIYNESDDISTEQNIISTGSGDISNEQNFISTGSGDNSTRQNSISNESATISTGVLVHDKRKRAQTPGPN